MMKHVKGELKAPHPHPRPRAGLLASSLRSTITRRSERVVTLSHFEFLDPHFGAAGDLHLMAAALRALAKHLGHRH